MRPPVLVACAHGTRDPVGARSVRGLVDAVRHADPSLDVREAFVDVQRPEVDDVVAGCERASVVVPLLLAAGFHVHVDIARATQDRDAVRSGTLGGDPALLGVLVDRLHEAGARSEDAVVLAAAGSSDPRARRDVERSARLLGAILERPVAVGYVASGGPTVAEQVARARARSRRVVVASYLLAPGTFWNRLHDLGADVVSDPLLAPDARADRRLVDLVLRRHAEAALGLRQARNSAVRSGEAAASASTMPSRSAERA